MVTGELQFVEDKLNICNVQVVYQHIYVSILIMTCELIYFKNYKQSDMIFNKILFNWGE